MENYRESLTSLDYSRIRGIFRHALHNKAMGAGFDAEYTPNAKNASKYQALYDQYVTLGRFVENQADQQ